jgi:hypothetical protein
MGLGLITSAGRRARALQVGEVRSGSIFRPPSEPARSAVGDSRRHDHADRVRTPMLPVAAQMTFFGSSAASSCSSMSAAEIVGAAIRVSCSPNEGPRSRRLRLRSWGDVAIRRQSRPRKPSKSVRSATNRFSAASVRAERAWERGDDRTRSPRVSPARPRTASRTTSAFRTCVLKF